MGEVVQLFRLGDEVNGLRELAKKQDIKPTAKKSVLVELADRCNGDDGRCFPSVKTIAKAIGASTRTVERHIQTLRYEGFLRWKAARAGGGEHYTNHYALLIDGYDSSIQIDRERLREDIQARKKKGGSVSGQFRHSVGAVPTICRASSDSVPDKPKVSKGIKSTKGARWPRRRRYSLAAKSEDFRE